MARSDERGFAIVMAMFMALMVSALAAAMTFTARTEAQSAASYTTMAQARYAAESGVAAAANYLLSSAYTTVAPGTGTDAVANYTMTVSPVVRAGSGSGPVVLSTVAGDSNYPVASVVTAFSTAARGALAVGGGSVEYGARARLVAMQQLTDGITGSPVVLQTWEITGVGWRTGADSATVEVTAVIERQPVPVYRYAAFATDNGCGALSFAGGATTRSYDSANLAAGVADTHGHVGTNGNLTGIGDPTVINGTLSTPRSGVGTCTTSTVTAATTAGWATIQEGLVNLPQAVAMPTPPAPSPVPPTSTVTFNSSDCPSGVSNCAAGPIITPSGSPVVLGNVRLSGTTTLRLRAGEYIVNSLTLTGNSTIIVDSGPVIIRVAGASESTPIDLAGGGVSNPSMDPTKLQFIYGGTGEVKITGGTDTAALFYAPRASASLSGSSTHFFGSIVTNKVTATGGFNLYYDRRLLTSAMTGGNPIMSTFSWRTF